MAGPIIKVTVAGDATPLNVTMGQASRTLAKFEGDAAAAANAVIAANVKQRESLQLLAAEYTKVAASAQVGSKEQVAASAENWLPPDADLWPAVRLAVRPAVPKEEL